jgi:hypothetical protein
MRRTLSTISATFTVACVAAIAVAPPASAKEAPVKEIPASSIGWETDKATKGKICTVASGHECQPGLPSEKPGGFRFAEAVAGGPASAGDIYVADRANHRVQKLNSSGQFLLMFGKGVNKNGGDVCTQAEETECQAGQASKNAGEFDSPSAIAVDPLSGDVYVAERVFGEIGGSLAFGERVQKFAPNGSFVLEIGKEVNETTKADTCTQLEIEAKNVKCAGPALHSVEVTPASEQGAFVGIHAITVGRPESGATKSRLYVAEKNGLQGFDSEGHAVNEPANAITAELAEASSGAPIEIAGVTIDDTGELYVVDFSNIIRRFDPTGSQTEFPVSPRTPDAEVLIGKIAVDPAGRLAVSESENGQKGGTLYEVVPAGLHQLTKFSIPNGLLGIGFNGQDELYATSSSPGQEIIGYTPHPVGELTTAEAACQEGAAQESDVTIECVLQGEVDAWGVPETEAWFEWGKTTALGEKTLPQQIVNKQPVEGVEETPVTVSSPIVGLLPNEATDYYYRLAGNDHWVKIPEELSSPLPLAHFKTPFAHPRIVPPYVASFETSSSVVLLGAVNPENGKTRYEFQYAPADSCASLKEGCSGIQQTESQESAAYGPTATTLEASGLQPAKTYRYRLYATNQAGGALDAQGGNEIPEDTFTTAPTPLPKASTGGFSQVGVASATISGMVDPDGEPATYAFELGIYSGSGTQYGTVFSGSAGAGTAPVEKALTVTGLQPQTTYAYRIKIQSGYGSATGAAFTFTTQATSTLIAPLAPPVLSLERPTFPREAATPRKCKHGYKLKHGRCAKTVKRSKGRKVSRRRGTHGQGKH